MCFRIYINKIFEKRTQGIPLGIPSYCTANNTVLQAVLQYAKDTNTIALIEATSNQCNQFGGYTGMTPVMFRDNLLAMAERIGLSRGAIILGGDHLGPLPWHDLPADEAMRNAKALVRDSVLAGFEKIHLDTSMYLGDDDTSTDLSKDTVAERGAVLYHAALQAFDQLRASRPDAPHPVFVIGSEVPPAGGAAGKGNKARITSAADMRETLEAYTRQFDRLGLHDAWNHIVALVVHLGIDYSNTSVYRYPRDEAAPLYSVLGDYPHLLLEGHSTDFQNPNDLRELVEDGTAILKVGPALTLAFREALASLVRMEEELVSDPSKRSHFQEILDEVMLEDPSKYDFWYRNSSLTNAAARKYSLLDRARYYLPNHRVQSSIHTLLNNIDAAPLPLGLLHWHMPMQYRRLVNNGLPVNARALVLDCIRVQIEDYAAATRIEELHP